MTYQELQDDFDRKAEIANAAIDHAAEVGRGTLCHTHTEAQYDEARRLQYAAMRERDAAYEALRGY